VTYIITEVNEKIALSNGITSQNGCFLAELLIEKEYEMHDILCNCPICLETRKKMKKGFALIIRRSK